jgi:1-deoxy-D-xylulose 5-phosphate reductoisomerase
MTRQRITVLGATGSIGTNTLDVIARHPDRFEVFALSAARQVEPLLAQCAQFRPRFAVMADAAAAAQLSDRLAAEGLPTRVLAGPGARSEIAAHPSALTARWHPVSPAAAGGLSATAQSLWSSRRLSVGAASSLGWTARRPGCALGCPHHRRVAGVHHLVRSVLLLR